MSKGWVGLIALGAAIILSGVTAHAEPLVQMLKNGDAKNRIDIIILGDGYVSSEMSKFQDDAQKFIDHFFTETPFLEYKKYFNVWRIDTPSSHSGASHDGHPGTTVYKSFYNCQGIERLLCVGAGTVEDVLQRSNVPGNKQDMILVIVNDPEYGGSGGAYSVTSTDPDAGEIAIHEFGHSFGRLDDEYSGSQDECDFYSKSGPIGGFNVTQQTTKAKIPWRKWIKSGTPLPTPPVEDGVAGLYKGAFYCTEGWYRPTLDSKMNTLFYPFYMVNTEQLIRRIYTFTSVLDKVSPKAGAVTISKNSKKTFSARAVDPKLASVTYTWRVNGKVKSTSKSIKLTGKQFGSKGTLDLVIKDATKMVKGDPKGALVEHVTWKLKRGP